MEEIEIKVLEVNVDAVKERLHALHAENHGEKLIEAWVYDTQGGDIQKSGGLLRVRCIEGKGYLTLKAKTAYTGELKVLQESETAVEDPAVLRQILEGLGYIQKQYQQKYRHTFSLQDVEVVIDRYPNIPPYIEIEGAEEHIYAVLEDLGLKDAKLSNSNVSEIIREYHGNPDMIMFE